MKKILFAVPVAASVAGLLALAVQTSGGVMTPQAPFAEAASVKTTAPVALGGETVQMTEWLQTASPSRGSKTKP